MQPQVQVGCTLAAVQLVPVGCTRALVVLGVRVECRSPLVRALVAPAVGSHSRAGLVPIHRRRRRPGRQRQ